MSDFVIRECRSEEVEAVLELWRQADATPSVTDKPDDLQTGRNRKPQPTSWWPRSGARIIGSIIGTFDGWRGNIYRLGGSPRLSAAGELPVRWLAEVEKKLTQQGAKRITALVEKDHPLATSFWQAVGYGLDFRIVRHVRTL